MSVIEQWKLNQYGVTNIDFEETSGPVLDSIGGYVGTLYGNPQRVPGKDGVGKAMQFNGVNQYVVMNDKVTPKGTKSIRLVFFVDPVSPSTMRIFGNSHDIGKDYGYYLSIFGKDLVLQYANASTTTSEKPIYITIEKGVWYDLIFVYDHNKKKMKSILNGELVSESDLSERTNPFTKNLSIGALSTNLNAGYFKGLIDKFQIYNYDITKPINRLFFEYNGKFYRSENGVPTLIGTEKPRLEELLNFSDEQIGSILNNYDGYKLYHFSDQTVSKPTLQATPNNQIMYSEGDILLAGVKTIDKISLISVGLARVAVSVDGGVTYQSFKNSEWVESIDLSTVMTAAELAALTPEQIQLLKGDSNTIRFAYYLTEDSFIDKITMTVTMEGKERMLPTTEFGWDYSAERTAIVLDFKKDGTYTVNYMDGK